MSTYNQLVHHDAPTNLDENVDFKPQIAHINMNYMLIWKKIEELKKELGRDRTIAANIISGGPGGLDHTLLLNLNSVNYYHVTLAQYNSLTGGLNSILHLHDSDRARANHTGTQLAATISDFTTAARLTLSGTAPITYNNVTGAIGLTQTGITNLNSALASGIVTITNGTGLLGSTPDNHVAWDAAAGASHVRLHNILDSADHGDSLTGAVTRGDIIYGNATPKWARLPLSVAGQLLFSNGTDVAWSATPYCSTLGLGVATPSRTLQLHDTGSGAVGMAATNGTTGATAADGAFFGIDSTEAAVMWQYENNHLYFGTNGTERVRINANGTVNIVGNTTIGAAVGSIPATALDVTGNVTISGLTVSTLIYSSAANVITSLANAAGYLTNNGAGVFSYSATATATAHNLLSATHGDTTAGACVIGDLVVGGAGPAWTKLTAVAVGQALWSGGVATLPAWSGTGYLTTSLVIGNTPIVAGSMLELYSAAANPIMTITGAHATAYDPQIQFRTDAVPTVKWSVVVDSTDDTFHISYGSGVGTTGLNIGTTGTIGVNVSANSAQGILYQTTITDSSNWGVYVNTTHNFTVDVGAATQTVGLLFQVNCQPAIGTVDSGLAAGVFGTAYHNGAGSLATLYAGYFTYGTNSTGGITGNSYGMYLKPQVVAGTTIATGYDIYIAAILGAGTITTNWSIYDAHVAPSYIAGQLRLGTTTGDAGITVTSYGQLWVNPAGGQAIGFYNQITSLPATNAEAIGYFNYSGYLFGYTQFRNLFVGNGKAVVVGYFDGTNNRFGVNTSTPAYNCEIYNTTTDAILGITGFEAKSAYLYLRADQGDDIADIFAIYNKYSATSASNLLVFANDNAVKGTLVDLISMSTTGDWNILGDAVAAGFRATFGAGTDMKIGYDGTYGLINTSLVAASDLKLTCGANKTIELQNVVYEDLQFPMDSAKVPAANYPDWTAAAPTANQGVFAFDVDDYLDLACQEIPHQWVEGGTIDFHIHVTTKDANSTGANRFVKFQLYVSYALSNTAAWSAWTESSACAGELTIPTGTAVLLSRYLDLGDLDLAGYVLGTQIKVRVKRIAATGGTEYASHIYVTQVGAHVKTNTMGSRAETTK